MGLFCVSRHWSMGLFWCNYSIENLFLSLISTPKEPHKLSCVIKHTATHCNALQHTATHCRWRNWCSTLQLTATQCNSPQHTTKHFITLERTTPHCKALYLVDLLCCSALQRAATHCNTVQHAATHCNTLQRTATHCNALQRTATHCNALQHCISLKCAVSGEISAAHCNTLQRTATHCNTLQHIATHCITL